MTKKPKLKVRPNEIVLELFPPGGGLKVHYPKKIKPRKTKEIKFNERKKSTRQKLDSFFFSNIVGMEYIFSDSKKLRKMLNSIKYGDQIIIKHEPKNKVDSFACAVFHKRKKIGYLPKYKSEELIERVKNNEHFSFFVYDLFPFNDGPNYFANSPAIVGLQNK